MQQSSKTPYDVFISYSREDSEEVSKICAELDALGIRYWIDRNIKGSANFLHEITKYISQCKVLLFVASKASAESLWTQKEVLFAINRNKKILPYRIGDFTFESDMELEFVFSNVQWIEDRDALINDIIAICGYNDNDAAINHTQTATKHPTTPKRRTSDRSKTIIGLVVSILLLVCGAGYFVQQHLGNSYEQEEYTPAYNDGKYPITRQRRLVPSDIEGMTTDELRIMRNEIYARHGYIFADKALHQYFSAQPWYRPSTKDINLNSVEQYNINFIKQYE